jgi:hypothetical protein
MPSGRRDVTTIATGERSEASARVRWRHQPVTARGHKAPTPARPYPALQRCRECGRTNILTKPPHVAFIDAARCVPLATGETIGRLNPQSAGAQVPSGRRAWYRDHRRLRWDSPSSPLPSIRPPSPSKARSNSNFRPAYDTLVRPSDSYTPIERERGLVRSNYLSGMYGGISMTQWQDILHLPGVEVAAQIANIGYILPFTYVPLRINRFLDNGSFQLFGLRTNWLANNATSRYPEVTFYVYYERRGPMVANQHEVEEVLPDGRHISPCFTFARTAPEGGPAFNPKAYSFSSRDAANRRSN